MASNLFKIEEEVRMSVNTVSKSFASLSSCSASTSNSITHLQNKSPKSDQELRKSDWRSLWIANSIAFFSAVQYSVFIQSIWPYLLSISNQNVTQVYYGFVVAAFCFFRGLSSPVYGRWSNRIRAARPPVLTGVCITIVGNVIYCAAEQLPPHMEPSRKWVVLGSRILMGCGGGMVPVLRSYVATASIAADRNKAIACFSFSSSIGGVVGAALQIACSFFGYPGYRLLNVIHINMFTAPALASICGMSIIILTVIFFFKENYVGVQSNEEKLDKYSVVPKYDLVAVVLILLIWFVIAIAMSNVDSILTPYAMILYDWTGQQAILYIGHVMLMGSCMTSCCYILLACTPLQRLLELAMDERKTALLGFACYLIYHLLTFPWSFYTGQINYQITDLSTGGKLVDNVTAVGCEIHYEWCKQTTKVPELVLFGAYDIFIALGRGPLCLPLLVLYSRVLGPRLQGTMQGFMSQIGLLGRTISPILITWLFSSYGPVFAWALQMGLLISCVCIIVLFYKRLVPLRTVDQLCQGDRAFYKLGVMYRL